MKHLFPLLSLVLLVSLFNIGCSKDEDEELPKDLVVNYTASFTDVASTLQDFIMKAQVYESSNFESLTADQGKKIINDYITLVKISSRVWMIMKNTRLAPKILPHG